MITIIGSFYPIQQWNQYMTDPQENAKELYLWLRTCPLDFLVLDMEGAVKRGTVKVVFDLICKYKERETQ